MNVVDMILFHAVHTPEKIAMAAEQAVLSYAQLAHGILSAEKKLSALDLGPGSLVGISIAHPIDHMVLSCALLHMGLGSAPIDCLTAEGADLPAPSLILADRILAPDVVKRFPTTIMLFDPSWFKEQTSAGIGSRARPVTGSSIARVIADTRTGSAPVVLTIGDIQTQVTHYYLAAHATWARMVTTLDRTSNPGFLLPWMTLWLGRTVCFAGVPNVRELTILHGHDYLVTTAEHAEALHALQVANYRSVQHLRAAFLIGNGFSEAALARARAALCGNLLVGFTTSRLGLVAFAPAARLAQVDGAAGLVAPWIEARCDDVDSGNLIASDATSQARLRVRQKRSGAGDASRWHDLDRAGGLRADGLLCLA